MTRELRDRIESAREYQRSRGYNCHDVDILYIDGSWWWNLRERVEHRRSSMVARARLRRRS